MTAVVQILTVDGLSKKYQRGSDATSFRELVSTGLKSLLGGSRRPQEADSTEEFWALKDVSFSLEEGTRLGVIGRNGAGKSTLLKLLSRITEPTAGSIKIYGRTASLLEIGTGFHPELTGRENIYLNGALLGMSRDEVRRKLDQIVAFAEIEKFLDEPVKHYSSGMYVRLGFAIAAHVDPQILMLDEVLAVGDLQFQRKCFGKMEELGRTARSVIFVSHDLAAVSSLCNRCIVLDAGRMVFDGPTSQGIIKYYEQNPLARNTIEAAGREIGDANARLIAADIVDEDDKSIIEAKVSGPVKIRMRYWLSGNLGAPAVPNFHFYRTDGVCAFVTVPSHVPHGERGNYAAEVTIPGHFLNEGMYTIGIALTTFLRGQLTTHFYERGALVLNVRDPREPGGLRDGIGYAGDYPGVVRPHFPWTVSRVRE